MTTYNTGNPVGSTDPRDLYDNAQSLDALVNSTTELSHADRLGVQRKTWHGMETEFDSAQAERAGEFAQFLADSAYQDLGVYGAGIEVTRYNQVFLKDGEFYRADASLGLPYTTTGLWASESGSFVGVGDAVLRQDLDAPGGSVLVGYDDGTAQDVLDEAKPIANYTTLRAYTGRATGVRITQSGLAGFFQRDDADTTSADNGGTVIVDASGRRWKRLFDGAVNVKWFGAIGNGVADDTAAWQAAIDANDHCVIDSRCGRYRVTTLSVNDKTLTFDMTGSVITATEVTTAVFSGRNSVGVFIGGEIDGSDLAKRGIDFRAGGSATVKVSYLHNFKADDMFCAAVYGSGIEGPFVYGCKIESVHGVDNGIPGDSAGASRGVYAISCKNPTVDETHITKVTGEEGDSIHFATGCTRPVATRNYIKGFSRRGIKDQSGGSLIHDNEVDDDDLVTNAANAAPAIEQVVGGGSTITRNRIVANVCSRGIQATTYGNTVEHNTVTIGTANAGENGFLGAQVGILVSGDHSIVNSNTINGGYVGWIVSGNYSEVNKNTCVDPRVEAGTLGPASGSENGIHGNGNVAIGVTSTYMPNQAFTLRNFFGGSFTNVSGNIANTNNVLRMTGTVSGTVIGPFAANQKFASVSGMQAGNVSNHVLTGRATYDPGSIAAGTDVTTNVTVTGAVIGSFVTASFSLSLGRIVLTGYVSASNTVTCSFFNPTGSAIDLGSGTLSVFVRSA